MAMRELLRVAMKDKQVKEACIEWARARTNTGSGTDAQVQVALAEDGLAAEVIFLKKRERKPRGNGATQPEIPLEIRHQLEEPDPPF